MRQALAERLLAKVMCWAPEDVARELPVLQALADHKYDEYQQFFPGIRFIESLALWLSQFGAADERRIAYDFIKKKLVFCSSAEMNHLVSIAYPDHVRPLLLRRAARDAGIDERLVSKIAAHAAFKIRQRQCLFLGLSDGARIDIFRRSNSPDLTHEQILPTYEVSPPRVNELLNELSTSVSTLLDSEAPEEMRKFRTIVLLDDFSGSGLSYLRASDGHSFKGKIGKFHRSLTAGDGAAALLVDIKQLEIIVVLYMATDKARSHLETLSKKVWEPLGVKNSIMVIHQLSDSICLHPDDGSAMGALIETYYDRDIEDQHTEIGGTDVKYGFAGCGLPLVLSHNTPNDSLPLLWADSKKMRALFPRVSRHRKET
ncbi:MAG: hypothetical protein HYU64_13935 [Armatimonadetes bacterium]|nr:hypothetical protein [Armatimonadota bacterium]